MCQQKAAVQGYYFKTLLHTNYVLDTNNLSISYTLDNPQSVVAITRIKMEIPYYS